MEKSKRIKIKWEPCEQNRTEPNQTNQMYFNALTLYSSRFNLFRFDSIRHLLIKVDIY